MTNPTNDDAIEAAADRLHDGLCEIADSIGRSLTGEEKGHGGEPRGREDR